MPGTSSNQKGGKAMIGSKLRRKIAVGIAAGAVFLGAGTAVQAALMYSVAPMPAMATVMQNQTLTMTFNVTMSMASTAPDAKMNLVDTTLALVKNGIVLKKGTDAMDEILAGSLAVTAGANSCFTFRNGKVTGDTIIGPGQSCIFKETFPTQDKRKPDPDMIAGEWTVTQTITAQSLDKKLNKLGTLATNFSFDAVVSDVPELSTWAMMLIGFAGVGLRLRQRNDRGAPT